MLRCPNYRDGLDATAPPGAGPAGSVEQEAADFSLLARSHLTPLAAPHDPCWRVERERVTGWEIRHRRGSSRCQCFSLTPLTFVLTWARTCLCVNGNGSLGGFLDRYIWIAGSRNLYTQVVLALLVMFALDVNTVISHVTKIQVIEGHSILNCWLSHPGCSVILFPFFQWHCLYVFLFLSNLQTMEFHQYPWLCHSSSATILTIVYITPQKSVTPQQLERISTAQLLVESCLPVGEGERETDPFIQNQNGCKDATIRMLKKSTIMLSQVLRWVSKAIRTEERVRLFLNSNHLVHIFSPQFAVLKKKCFSSVAWLSFQFA